jgi:hypothetical protein
VIVSDAPPWRVEKARHPEPGESLSGFIGRVAAAEGLPNTLEITSLGGAVHPAHPALSRGGDFEPIAAVLGVTPIILAGMAYPEDADRRGRRLFRGMSIDHRFITHDERRFAPGALGKRSIHLAEWQLSPFPFCQETWEYLRARCPDPDCLATQRWYHAQSIDLCDQCGEPLRHAVHGSVPPEQQESLRNAIGLFDRDAKRRRRSLALLPPVLRRLPPGDLLDLLVALAGVHDPSIRCQRDQRVFRSGIDESQLTTAMAEAWRVACAWPEGFTALAAKRIAARGRCGGDGNRGATMRFLDLGRGARAPSGLSPIVADLVRHISTTASISGCAVYVAASLPMVRPPRLLRLRREGTISTIFALVNGEPEPFLDREEIQALSNALCTSKPLNVAASILGMDEHGAVQLAAMGILGFQEQPGAVAPDGTPMVPLALIESLVSAVADGAADPKDDWVPLATVMHMVGGRLKPWGPFVSALLAGRVRYGLVGGNRPAFRRITLDPACVQNVAGLVYHAPAGALFHDKISKKDVLTVLNLHARHGASALSRWPTKRSGERSVPVDELLAMATSLISVGEIALRLGGRGMHVHRLLTKHGIKPNGPWCPRKEVEAELLGVRVGVPVEDS